MRCIGRQVRGCFLGRGYGWVYRGKCIEKGMRVERGFRSFYVLGWVGKKQLGKEKRGGFRIVQAVEVRSRLCFDCLVGSLVFRIWRFEVVYLFFKFFFGGIQFCRLVGVTLARVFDFTWYAIYFFFLFLQIYFLMIFLISGSCIFLKLVGLMF